MTKAMRRGNISNVETLVGFCAHFLPRLIGPIGELSVANWPSDLQSLQAEERTHDRYQWLDMHRWFDLHRWLGLPMEKRLSDAVIVFENAPAADALAKHDAKNRHDAKGSGGIHVVSFDRFGADDPLCLVIAGETGLGLSLTFGRQRFDAHDLARLLDNVVELIRAIVADPERRERCCGPTVSIAAYHESRSDTREDAVRAASR
ncbi:hypothetical protein ACVIJ6_000527 [Bradyrhizobium sp. USDA 4369]